MGHHLATCHVLFFPKSQSTHILAKFHYSTIQQLMFSVSLRAAEFTVNEANFIVSCAEFNGHLEAHVHIISNIFR